MSIPAQCRVVEVVTPPNRLSRTDPNFICRRAWDASERPTCDSDPIGGDQVSAVWRENDGITCISRQEEWLLCLGISPYSDASSEGCGHQSAIRTDIHPERATIRNF